MAMNRTRVWYDLTMSLTYPSILGAIIYFFFDATIQVYGLSVLERTFLGSNPGQISSSALASFHFFEAFGLAENTGFLSFLGITFFVMIHHSADYLYSKYSEPHYGFRNFLWDTAIALLLAIAYIVLSNAASGSFRQITLAFTVFWISLVITYLIFLWWDAKAYQELRKPDKPDPNHAEFYLKMIFWFEISGIVVFLAFAVLPVLAKKVNWWFTYTYVVASIIVLAVFCVWFCSKVHALEILSRKDQASDTTRGYGAKVGAMDEILCVRQMEAADIAECVPIFVDAYREVYSEPWTAETGQARLSELYQMAPAYCLTLRVDTGVAGFVLARPFSWHDGTRVWVEEIVVGKRHRGKGLGKLLIRTLMEICQSRNIVGVSLISEGSSVAFSIYERMGLHPSDWVHLEADLAALF